MENQSFTLDKETLDKLQRMVDSNDAANLSHAVRKCVSAYPEPLVKKAA